MLLFSAELIFNQVSAERKIANLSSHHGVPFAYGDSTSINPAKTSLRQKNGIVKDEETHRRSTGDDFHRLTESSKNEQNISTAGINFAHYKA